MSEREVLYYDGMTTLTQDEVTQAIEHETRLVREPVRPRSKWLTAPHWVDVGVATVLWGAVLMTASGLGLLLSAIVDTVRYGHP